MPTRKTKQEKNVEMVVDQVGEVDGDVEAMPEIELSSDEEDEEDDCALIVLKRPPVTERTIEEVEVRTLVKSVRIAVSSYICSVRSWRMVTSPCAEREQGPLTPKRRTAS